MNTNNKEVLGLNYNKLIGDDGIMDILRELTSRGLLNQSTGDISYCAKAKKSL